MERDLFKFIRPLALCLAVAAAGDLKAQPTARTWRAPSDASIVGCYDAKAKGVFMNDGSLLVACIGTAVKGAYNNAPLWQRSPDGTWRMAAQPPTRYSYVADLRKINGKVAAIRWSGYRP